MESLINLITEPLAFEFMQRAVLAGIIVGAICGLVGTYVVVRSMSFFGDALAHSVLPGVAVAYIITGGAGLSLFLGGLIAGIGSAIVIGWLTRDGRMKEDTAIGIVFVAMFALGIAIISSDSRAYGRDLVHVLFGNILGIRPEDLLVMAISAVIVFGVIVLFYKEFLVISFDVSLAKSLRLPVETLRILLLILIAITIIASLQIVGIALTLAMLLVPAATAQQLSNRLHIMMLIAVLIGIVGSVIGIYISYYANIATGPAIVLTVTVIFVLVLVLQSTKRKLQGV